MTRNEQVEQQYKDSKQAYTEPQTLENFNTALHQPIPDNDVKFTFVFPSRERVMLLDQMISSVHKNAANIANTEILIAVDDDDEKTIQYFRCKQWPFVRVFYTKRSLNFSRDYYDMLAHHSKGKWIITANDDCVMETPKWDLIAYNTLKDKSGVIYGWIEDNLGGWRAKGHGNYCCFPLQGRAGFEALGYIFPSRVPTWGADIWAKNLYNQIGSVTEIPITLKHYCHHNKTRNQDDISRRIESNQVPFDIRPTYQEINTILAAFKKETVKI